ncbi:MAG: folate-binding protein [Oceanospirillaceae bacterium]
MKSSLMWQQLLTDLSLNEDKGDSSNLSVYPLTYQSLYCIDGVESEKFLQGQLSCDMREVAEGHSRLAAHCTPKGSMLSLMRVMHYQDTFMLRINNANSADAAQNLTKYMMFSKAELTDLSDQWFGFGIEGLNIDKVLCDFFGELPTATNQVIQLEGKLLVKVPGDRYELWLKSAQAKDFLEIAVITKSLVSCQHWLKQEITNNIPDIYPASSNCYIPQMCNLQALQGVSFRKGCYTGQEIITRLHFRGKLNKFLLCAKINSENLIEEIKIGSYVHCEAREKIGSVLQFITIDDVTYLQIVISFKHANDTLYLDNNAFIENIAQPYTLDPELFTRKD